MGVNDVGPQFIEDLAESIHCLRPPPRRLIHAADLGPGRLGHWCKRSRSFQANDRNILAQGPAPANQIKDNAF
jgi:hypothetical protein